MKVALVGGAGFIGSRLRARLERRGVALRVIDRKPDPGGIPEYACLDIRDASALCAAVQGCTTIINLAAEHRDDVFPRRLYDEVNVQGARNVCAAAVEAGIAQLVFTSSVAVYGAAPPDTDESGPPHPFNEYGRTKLEAEQVYRGWLQDDPSRRSLAIVRPTVVFGEKNRGNVYNLLRQVAGEWCIIIGNGRNRKSMAYVENVAAYLEHCLGFGPGEHLFNYIDKPDFDMSALVSAVRSIMGRRESRVIRLPRWFGSAVGSLFDLASAVTGKRFPISALRVRKFCMETSFASSVAAKTAFRAPVPLRVGLENTVRYEFVERHTGELFHSE